MKVLLVFTILKEMQKKMWKMIHEHKIESLFQMEQQSGIKGYSGC